LVGVIKYWSKIVRVMIESTDRIGISQEILGVFAQQAWNLKQVEIISRFTYAHVEYKQLTLLKIHSCLSHIDGFITVNKIALLPSEQRENHLQALLAKIPEPIIDLDKEGVILAVNQATKNIFGQDNKLCLGISIEALLKQEGNIVVSEIPSSRTITVESKAYIADLTPVFSDKTKNNSGELTGAVLVLRSMDSLGRQISLMQSHQENGFDAIIGQSNKIKLIKEQSQRYAQLDLPVLIIGETGTGKELVARALHHESGRAKYAFLAINCAALPEHLLESELFGYASGAFTGARKGGKPGLIELAEGGSLFLDEIAEMSPYLQAKLLRFLQNLNYRRVGGTKELTANVRIISASHQNLPELIVNKSFREDLFYRLNVLNVFLPPLRERISDIELLANFFIKNAVKQVTPYQSGKQIKVQPIPKLGKQALGVLQKYQWPGNIRQLQNILFSTVALNKNTDIAASDLQQVLAKFTVIENQSSITVNKSDIKDWSSAQADFEKSLLKELYPLYPTTRKLAERLHVSHNKIAMKLREHNIKP
jgi:TyrR family helix-turn-helix protein